MRNKSTKSKRNYQKIIFMSFIIFCVGVLAWDIANNGFSAAFGDLPAAAQIDDIPEPNESSDNSTLTDTSANTNNTTIPEETLTPEEEAAAAFAQLRMEREEARDEEIALLERIIEDENSSTAALEDAEARRIAIASDIENEITAESLQSTKGYGETVVMIGSEQTTVIVDLEIDEQDAAIIAEIVDKASGCGFENVVIVKR